VINAVTTLKVDDMDASSGEHWSQNSAFRADQTLSSSLLQQVVVLHHVLQRSRLPDRAVSILVEHVLMVSSQGWFR